MRDIDDLLIAAHDALANEYLEEHPDATDEQAYAATDGQAWDRMTDMLADMADHAADSRGDR